MTSDQFCFLLAGICEGVGETPTKLLSPDSLLERLAKVDCMKHIFVSVNDASSNEDSLIDKMRKEIQADSKCQCDCHLPSADKSKPCRNCGCELRLKMMIKPNIKPMQGVYYGKA